jgi:hypothetical protein
MATTWRRWRPLHDSLSNEHPETKEHFAFSVNRIVLNIAIIANVAKHGQCALQTLSLCHGQYDKGWP